MEQESALAQLMVDQYNMASANYHKWLTPEGFGAQFGPADADIQTVTAWLRSHGFQVAKVSRGKVAIEFSGTAAEVLEAFHTEIHKFVVHGETHFANTSDPQVPVALTPVVRGLAPLNNFRARPSHRIAGEYTRSAGNTEVKPVNPEFTTSGGVFAIGPTDFATDRKSTRLNSSHSQISYAVFCLKKKNSSINFSVTDTNSSRTSEAALWPSTYISPLSNSTPCIRKDRISSKILMRLSICLWKPSIGD